MTWKDAFTATFWLGFLVAFGWLAFSSPDEAQVGPANQILCNQGISFTGTGAEAQVLAAATGKTTALCGWHVTSTSSTTTTFQLFSGSGTNCGTGGVALTPALNVTLTAPSADHIDWASLSVPTPNNALCVNAPTTVTGILWISQF